MQFSRWMLRSIVSALFIGMFFSTQVYAAELTDVADAFDTENKNPFDARFQLSYELFSQSASIYREKAHPTSQFFCYGKSGGCTNPAEFNLRHMRHSMNIRAAIGIYKDLELFLNVPLVLYESIYASVGADAKKDGTATLLKDKIVQAEEMEARHTSVFGDMSIGFRWLPFNDQRDRTVSTWLFGLSWTFPTGSMWNPLKLQADPSNPNILTGGGVGMGLHRLTVEFGWSKRMWFLDPYVHIQFQFGLASGENVRNDLLDPEWLSAQKKLIEVLQKEANASTNAGNKQRLTKLAQEKQRFIDNAIRNSLSLIYQVNLSMGSEFVFYENDMRQIKIALDLRFVLFATFQGRSPVLFADMMQGYRPTHTERGQTVPDRASLLTDHESFFTLYFQPALHAKLGKYGYLRLEGKFGSTLPFLFTRAQRGSDLNKNGFVDLQTAEVYPFHTRTLDGVGKRLQQRDTVLASFLIHAGLTF